MRYSLLKRTGAGQYEETDIDSTFRSGDGIRVSIESNDDAYLYLVNKGSKFVDAFTATAVKLVKGN